MSREIKTRETCKDIKVLDESVNGLKRMRQASVRIVQRKHPPRR